MLWKAIEKQLKEKGWSIYRLAREAKVSESGIGHLKNGQVRDLKFSTVVKIADALDVSLDEFR